MTPPTTTTIKAVVFDMGGVLVPSPMEYWKGVEQSLNLPPGSIANTILSPQLIDIFKSLERGEISLEDIEPLFIHFYNKQNSQQCQLLPSFKVLSDRYGANAFGSFSATSTMIALIELLKANGVRVMLLTNNWFTTRKGKHNGMEETVAPSIRALFGGDGNVMESCRLGVRKPDVAVYEKLMERLKLLPQSVVFIDDMGTNLKPAAAMGIKTIKHSSIGVTIDELEKVIRFSLKAAMDDKQLDVPNSRLTSKDEFFNEAKLQEYLNQLFPATTTTTNDGCMLVRKFTHGQSNPTFYIRWSNRELVLRKQPSGRLLHPSAHRIDREFRIQQALHSAGVPVPKLIAYAEKGIMDTPFYLMDYCCHTGQIFNDPNLPELGTYAEEKRAVYKEMCRILAAIHNVDHTKVGLSNLNSGGGGYVKRVLQVARGGGGGGKRLEELYRRLTEKAKEVEGETTLVHGDYRLDNLVFDSSTFKITAILDWELSTLGDPLADLATCLFPYYYTNSCSNIYKGISISGGGIPSVEECMDEYFLHRRRRRHQPHSRPTSNQWLTYVALAAFRNASLVLGIRRRAISGQASNASINSAAELDLLVDELAGVGLKLLQLQLPEGEERKQRMESFFFPTTPEAMSPKARQIHNKVELFIQQRLLPLEQQLIEYSDGPLKWTPNPLLDQLKQEAQSLQLWNLFITQEMDPLGKWGGAGLTTAEYAHICELTGTCAFAPEIFNCNAPDSGNMEVLIKYGNEEQQLKYLPPLLNGTKRSCFAMTEKDVASSDATNIQATIVKDQVNKEYVLNGRKWFTSGAADPRCTLCLFMGKHIPLIGGLHKQQSILLVPFPCARGITVVRHLNVLGTVDAPGGHCEVEFTNVRVPCSNIILGEGRGFEIAQGRLGPGRIHHCMRLIGHAQRAIHLMCQRSMDRITQQKKLFHHQSVRLNIAKSVVEVEQARLLVLKAAHQIDTVGAKGAANDIAMIKVVAPKMAYKVLDRAIQLFGAAGLTSDWPMAGFLIWARSLRLADGPDVVHLEAIAKRVMKDMKAHL